ncbi:YfhJ family protein [Alteribacillus sp. HJP-4]|uniref:YfhJ family protein n=1 Tax=Alteribacillus sp. HJP-4 TaxID=2775394 RepID=UPI0035CCF793
MEDIFQRLTDKLLFKNNQLSSAQARAWVEHFWEDFETTRAKAGRSYQGAEATERIVETWIEQYCTMLHLYEPTNKKFSHLKDENNLKH